MEQLVKPACLVPECGKDQRTRWLCSTHYTRARNMIRDGAVTEEDLVARGILAPKKPSPARVRDFFLSGKVEHA